MSVLAPAPDFDAEDGFLHALLGLLAAAEAVRAVAQTSAVEAAHVAVEDAGDPVLDAILGIIRLSALASQAASSWATVPREAAPELERTASLINELLR